VVVALRLAVLHLDRGDQGRHGLDVDRLCVNRHPQLQGLFDDRSERLPQGTLRDQRAYRERHRSQHQEVVHPPARRPGRKEHHGRGRLREQNEREDQVGLAGQAGDPVVTGLTKGREEEEPDADQSQRRGERRSGIAAFGQAFGAHDGQDAISSQAEHREDDEPAGGPEGQAPLDPGHAWRKGQGEESARHR
jgi:hypothetical protein